MVLFNYAIREITAKIVYYGPGLGGKTTNLQKIHESLDTKSRGKLISLATDADRTLFFDFLPLDLGQIGGYRIRFQLYTVPGQVHYNATRKLVLKGVDAVVFVADSQIEMLERNRESFDNLRENLTENGYDFGTIPIVYQFNKQDLPNVATPREIAACMGLDLKEATVHESVALEGKGVFETLKAVIKLTIKKLRSQFDEGQMGMAAKPKTKAARKETAPEAPGAPLEKQPVLGKKESPPESEPEPPVKEKEVVPEPAPAAGPVETAPLGRPVVEAEAPEAEDEVVEVVPASAAIPDGEATPPGHREAGEVDLESLLSEQIPIEDGGKAPAPSEWEEIPAFSARQGRQEETVVAEAPADLEEIHAAAVDEPPPPKTAVHRTEPAEALPGEPGAIQPPPDESELWTPAAPLEPEADEVPAGSFPDYGEQSFVTGPAAELSNEEYGTIHPPEDLPDVQGIDFFQDWPERASPVVESTAAVSDIQEVPAREEAMAPPSEEPPPSAETVLPSVPRSGEHAPLEAWSGRPVSGGSGPAEDSEMAAIRGKQVELEKGINDIKKTLEEQRILMNKFIDIAVGRMFKAQNGSDEPESVPPGPAPRRGFLARLFGG